MPMGLCQPPPNKDPVLTAEDKKYLDGLMKEFLFDPIGAERVSVKANIHTIWGVPNEVEIECWLVPGKVGRPGRVYFTDETWIPAPADKDIKKIDFVAACQGRYAAVPKPKAEEKKDEGDSLKWFFNGVFRPVANPQGDDDLTRAVWLHRIGQEGLAAQALVVARAAGVDPRKRLRAELAWLAFTGMVDAYAVRADEEALAHGERLLRLYPEEAKDENYGQAALVMAELKRRQQKGTFGKAPPENWPDGFETWDVRKKAAYLIDALDEMDARPTGQRLEMDVFSDRRIKALIGLGDAAVPDLIAAFEKEERLTRTVGYVTKKPTIRSIFAARKVLLVALLTILRVSTFEPAGPFDKSPAGIEQAMNEVAKNLRAYWKEYGHLPFDQRMMKVLTDPHSGFPAKREAAKNLAALRENSGLQQTGFAADRSGQMNPAVAKFSKPTVAEAILAALDADLKAHNASSPKNSAEEHYKEGLGIELTYLLALRGLGDQRIAPELAKRTTASEKPSSRLGRGMVAHFLGDSKPIRSFMEDFRAGKFEFTSGPAAEWEVGMVFDGLIKVGIPEAEPALNALADPKHPLHKAGVRQVILQCPLRHGQGQWFWHPSCLGLLRSALDDTSATGLKYEIKWEGVWRFRTPDVNSPREGFSLPQLLTDQAARREEVDERFCDAAAMKLSEIVIGLPSYHPLCKDADKRLMAFRIAFDRFRGSYRKATEPERACLGMVEGSPAYLPDISPLGRAATAEDVKAGKAVFHLDGKGKPANLMLPAFAEWKSEVNKDDPRRLLIVQAEVGPDGDMVYGVLMRNDIRTVPARELVNIKALAQLEKEGK